MVVNYTNNGKKLRYVSYEKNVRFEVMDGCEFINDKAFAENNLITEIVVPSSVTRIGGGAFFAMKNLRTVRINSAHCQIGEMAFDGCVSLRSIIVPDGSISFYEKQIPNMSDFIEEE